MAMQPAMITALKKILDERYVPHLPPLLGNANPVDAATKEISRALSAYAISTKFEVDALTASRLVVDDYEDHGIDAFYYDDASKTLYIIQSKLKESEQFKLSEAQALISGLELILAKDFDSFNQNVKNIEQYIENALDECEKICLLIACTGDGVSQQASNELRQKLQDLIDGGEEQLQVDPIVFGADDIEAALREESAVRPINEKVKIHKYRTSSSPRYSVFGLMRVSELVGLYEKHGKKLYEKNIRYYIGSGKRGVNTAIRDTLVNEPENFQYLNNGITMVGNHVEAKSNVRGSTLTKNFNVLGLSVVNGAQTISSASQFVDEHPDADISTAQVMVTLINTGQEQFHKKVTKARNLQNPVELSNFAALDDNQERLRQEIKLYGVEYHYRPQRVSTTGVKVITIESLSKALGCLYVDIRYPARLKSDPSQFTTVNSEAYKKIFTDDLTGIKAVNATLVYEQLHKLILTAEKGSISPEKLVYRHCSYAIISILMKHFKDEIDGDSLLSEADIALTFSTPFDEVRQLFADNYEAQAQGAAPHAFFKRIPDTKDLIYKVWIEYLNLVDDETVQNLIGRVAGNDPYNQALYRVLSSKANQLELVTN